MNYHIRQLNDNNTWNAFVMKQPYSLFVQSSQYGDFYASMGEPRWMFGIFDEQDVLVGGSLCVGVHAKRGNFLYLPYGPILPSTTHAQNALLAFDSALTLFAHQHAYDFIRISPFYEAGEHGMDSLVSLGYKPAPMHVLAEHTWLLRCNQTDNLLFAGMKKNHRNLIRRCEREGVKVEMTTNEGALNILDSMLEEVGRRHDFHRFSRSYIQKEFNSFAPIGEATIFVSRLPDGRPDAAAIIMFYGSMACYRHSASLNLDKRLPTSYLIQWRVIQEARKRGMTWYNFWGIAPEDAPTSHPFKGITHFKQGFGGIPKNLVQCHDKPITKKYWLNWIIEYLRSRRRGFS